MQKDEVLKKYAKITEIIGSFICHEDGEWVHKKISTRLPEVEALLPELRQIGYGLGEEANYLVKAMKAVNDHYVKSLTLPPDVVVILCLYIAAQCSKVPALIKDANSK